MNLLFVRRKILNFAAEMDKKEIYKDRIDDILIKGKGYLAPNFSAQQLAERLGISIFALSRLLKATYGMSYSDIVHTYRIQDAVQYLKDRRFALYSMDDIGTMVGFRNRQSFFAAFKKATGTTPDKFRHT